MFLNLRPLGWIKDFKFFYYFWFLNLGLWMWKLPYIVIASLLFFSYIFTSPFIDLPNSYKLYGFCILLVYTTDDPPDTILLETFISYLLKAYYMWMGWTWELYLMESYRYSAMGFSSLNALCFFWAIKALKGLLYGLMTMSLIGS